MFSFNRLVLLSLLFLWMGMVPLDASAQTPTYPRCLVNGGSTLAGCIPAKITYREFWNMSEDFTSLQAPMAAYIRRMKTDDWANLCNSDDQTCGYVNSSSMSWDAYYYSKGCYRDGSYENMTPRWDERQPGVAGWGYNFATYRIYFYSDFKYKADCNDVIKGKTVHHVTLLQKQFHAMPYCPANYWVTLEFPNRYSGNFGYYCVPVQSGNGDQPLRSSHQRNSCEDGPRPGCALSGNPVDISQENKKTQTDIDLVVAGDFPIVWERSYFPFNGSSDKLSPDESNWHFSHMKRADISHETVSGKSNAWMVRKDGSVLLFESYDAPGNARQWKVAWANMADNFQIKTFRSTLKDWMIGSQWNGVILNNDMGEKEYYNKQGQLVKVENLQGKFHFYHYNANGLLIEIEQENGRKLTIQYEGEELPTPENWGEGDYAFRGEDPDVDPVTSTAQIRGWNNLANRKDLFIKPVIASVSDGTRTVEYVWERVNVLSPVITAVQKPGGAITTYHYEDGHDGITGITDSDNKRIATYRYQDWAGDKVQSEWKGSGINTTEPKIDYLEFNGGVLDGLGNQANYIGGYHGSGGKVYGFTQDCPSCSGDIYRQIAYNSAGLIERTQDFNWVNTTYTYDSRGRLASRTEAAGLPEQRVFNYTWHPDYNLVLTESEPVIVGGIAGHKNTVWTYNDRQQPTQKKVTAPVGSGTQTRIWNFSYDAQHRLKKIEDPAGQAVELRYNSAGDLIARIVNPGAASQQLTRWGGYQADGLPRWSVDDQGIVTTLQWDLDGNLLSSIQAAVTGVDTNELLGNTSWTPTLPSSGQRQTTYVYSEAGRLMTVTQPDQTSHTFDYDRAGRLIKTTSKGTNGTVINTTHLTYDIMSNITKTEVKNAQNETVVSSGNTRDVMWRVKDSLNAAGEVLYTTTYDNESFPYQSDDSLNRTRINHSDNLGRLIKQVDAAGEAFDLAYGPQDEIRSAKDARGIVTTYEYNGFGEMTTLVSPDRGTWTFTYDNAGRMVTTHDPRGVVVTTTYDASSRPLVRTFSASGVSAGTPGFEAGSKAQAFSYDTCAHGRGKVCGISDDSGQTSYVYNAWGNLVGKAWTAKATGPAAGIVLSTGYGYDNKGRLASITYPSGKTQQMVYGTDGLPLSLNYAGQPVVANVKWTANGNVGGWAWPMAAGWSGVHDQVKFSYDADGRPVKIKDLDERTLVWDSGNRLLGVDDAADANATQLYEYDVEDRLTSADVGAWNSPVLFSYDAVGNRTVISDGQNGDSWQYGYGLNTNRLTSQKPVLNGVSGTELNSSYDAMGNLVNDGIGLQLSYDVTGRLVQGSKGPQSMNAVYNAMGQRIIKTSGSSVRVYAVDEVGRPLGVYVVDANASNGYRVEEEYIHLDGWRPVAVIRPDAATGMNNPQLFPILSDHLGTPRKVLDGNSGQVRWTWDAKQPFGHELPNETPTAGLDPFVFDLRFPGQRYDEETGLFQNGFRDYHPGLGRYVQSDPIGLDGGWNTYSYVSGNPMGGSDSMGLKIDPKAWENIYFVEAIVYLSQSAEGRKIIDEVESAFITVNIKFTSNGDSSFQYKYIKVLPSAPIYMANVNWDPHMGLYDSAQNACVIGLSPAMNLIHEFIHFLQVKNEGGYESDVKSSNNWENNPKISKEYYSDFENEAVQRERIVAGQLGEWRRQTYNKKGVRKEFFQNISDLRPSKLK